MEEHQLKQDAALHRIHTDLHQLAGSLLDIAQRLEDRLGAIAGLTGLSSAGVQKAPPPEPEKSTVQVAGEGLQGVPPSVVVHSSKPRQKHLLALGGRHLASPQRVGRQLGGSVTGMDSDGDSGLEKSRTRQMDLDASEVEPEQAQQQLELLELLPDKGAGESEQPDGQKSNLEESSKAVRKQTVAEGQQDAIAGATGPQETTVTAAKQLDWDSRFGAIDKKLEQIAGAIGFRGPGNENDDDEDRKRLKEKLKQAIEADRRSRVRTIVSRGERWLEYMFGICPPDQRIGKRGSRYPEYYPLCHRVVTESVFKLWEIGRALQRC
jgi:hypothetical protein